MTYRIREVDGEDESDVLRALHTLTFFDTAKLPKFDDGLWWIAYYGDAPVGFINIIQSVLGSRAGYFKRVGVIPAHRGQGLQRRLMRAMEAKARKIGWTRIVSDTTDNPPSTNNMFNCGYRTYEPEFRWANPLPALYWQKRLT
jgi:GNAT superfamily N-acetyltransferase